MQFNRNSSLALLFVIYFLAGVSTLFIVTSCEEASFIGIEIQPDSDRFKVNTYHDHDISTSVVTRDSILGVAQYYSLLGLIDDPLFGLMEASFMTQLGVYYYLDFGPDPVADSLVLYLHVTDTFIDESNPMDIMVYEISELLDHQTPYYTNIDYRDMTYEDEVLAVHTITRAIGDTLIAIPISSDALKDKLLFAPDSVNQSIGAFISYFNGLYVKTFNAAGSGNLFRIDLDHKDSQLSFFYKNSDHADSTLRYDYIINENANRINLYEHDYSRAVFHDVIGQTETEDTVFYIQGAAGVMGRLDFEHLHTWRDSILLRPVSINSARLVIPVETNDPTAGSFPLPDRLTLFERDSDGRLFRIIDLELGDQYFDGIYNATDKSYSFKITNWVQAYLRGKKDDTALYVAVRDGGILPNRAVLRNNNHPSGGLKLEIVYTKH